MTPLHVVIFVDTRFDRVMEITSPENVIGRRDTCQICLPDPSVSRTHASVTALGTDWMIKDLASRNGTCLDGTRLTHDQKLTDGCEVQVGCFRLKMLFRMDLEIRDVVDPDDSTWSYRALEAENQQSGLIKLTPRQQRVYSLLLDGLLEKEVAAELGISIHTVHWHAKAIYRAFSVSTRAELISQATRGRPNQSPGL